MSLTSRLVREVPHPEPPLPPPTFRPRAAGKFFYVGNNKLYLCGVTYGTFHPDARGDQYGSPQRVSRDFHAMSQNGINAVRVYTVPPRWLLDTAARYGLYVMIGIPWEQHVAFLDGRRRMSDIEKRVREAVKANAGHPAVLCYSIANEIPASLVRWYGRRRVERFLYRLYRAAKDEDPEALVTYVNFPTTEYLDLPFLDFVSFNVYLEERDKLDAYLARLQNQAGDRPLVMAEIGLDSRHNGEERQAEALEWQIRSVFEGGCAGAFVFAWTDEWYRGEDDVEDWDFGLTTRDRIPKPALYATQEAFRNVPFPVEYDGTVAAGLRVADSLPPVRSGELPAVGSWPYVSIVVCSHNGARTLRDCCEGLLELDYPHFDVVLVDDGSTDATAGIAEEYGFRVIRTANRGLSSARNTGLEAARGEIVAYLDDDARPDPHWLSYLAHTFLTTEYVGVGGPNIIPSESGAVAWCVENAPGGPVHVLLNDRDAEHIPGCNMAFRKEALLAVGGFDPIYRTAGDDVDICWKLQAQGWKLGFNPAAVVWHCRRNSVRAYWRQQVGYGRAEALLEKKWPEKYNTAGHLSWQGRLYGGGLAQTLGMNGGRIYGGVWGSAPFQSVYGPPINGLLALPTMPEWYALIGLLALLSLLGLSWTPLLFALPLLFVAVATLLAQSVLGAIHARFPVQPLGSMTLGQMRLVTFLLHLIQPVARLLGRFANGLTPWRRSGAAHSPFWLFDFALWRRMAVWRETWQPPEAWLEWIEGEARERGCSLQRGGDFDYWDLKAQGGIFASARLKMGLEEHGQGRQLARFRITSRVRMGGILALLLFAGLAVGAFTGGALFAAYLLSAVGLLLAGRTLYECSIAVNTLAAGVSALPGVQLAGSGKPLRARPYHLLVEYAAPLWKGWLLILALTIAGTLFSLLQPWPLKVLIDNVLGGQALTGVPGRVASYLPSAGSPVGLAMWVAIGSLLVLLGAGLLDALLTYNWVRTGQGMVYTLARHLFSRIQRRSPLFHSRNSVGDSMGRITTDAWAVHTAVDNLLFAPAGAVFTATGVIAVMLAMDPMLTLLSLVVVPFMVISALVFRKRMKQVSRSRRRIESGMQSHVQRTLSSISVVQAFTREQHEQNLFSQYTRDSIRAQQRGALIGGLYGLGSGLANALGAAVVVWAGAHEVMAGRLTVGALLVFVAYLGTLQAQLKVFAGTYRTMQEATGSFERVSEVLNVRDEVTSKPGAGRIAVHKSPAIIGEHKHLRTELCPCDQQWSVRFRNVTFGYLPGKAILRDFSLDIAAGETIAIVGATGAGKSTLAGLTARLYDPWWGQIEIAGYNLRDVSLESARSVVAAALQEPYLLPATVEENIRYGRPSATPDEVQQAARAAGAHCFIENMPDGYNTLLGERGATLSGGERQRLSIARALLKDAPILILDEPTSALDVQTEKHLVDSLAQLRAGKTTVIISHRLSTVRNVDRIVVLDAGKIVEQGTHDSLLASNGAYARLHRLQTTGNPPRKDQRSSLNGKGTAHSHD